MLCNKVCLSARPADRIYGGLWKWSQGSRLAVIYLHIISTQCTNMLLEHTQTHTPFPFFSLFIVTSSHTKNMAVNGRSQHKPSVLCFCATQRSWATLTSAPGSRRVTAMSHGRLESQLCSLTHSLQTLHHAFTRRSHRAIHAEKKGRKGTGGLFRQGMRGRGRRGSLCYPSLAALLWITFLVFFSLPGFIFSPSCNLL